MSKRSKGCLGCGVLAFGFFVLLMVIALVVGPQKQDPAASTAAPISPAATTATAAAAPTTPKPSKTAAPAPKPTPKATTPPPPSPTSDGTSGGSSGDSTSGSAGSSTGGSTSGSGVSVILSPSGKHYRAGEFCPHADDGLSTVDADGNTITCSDVNGYYRWHY